MKTRRFFSFLLILLLGSAAHAFAAPQGFPAVRMGMGEEEFFKSCPKEKLRTFRHSADDEWFSFNRLLDDPVSGTVTVHFHKGTLASVSRDDRAEVVREYMDEFCFYEDPSMIFKAVREVLMRMPYKDFLSVTRRERPMLFTEFYDAGTARFASSSEFIVSDDEPPCCQQGFTIVKLGMGLGGAKTPGPIEGVVAHEIAHRVLDSIKKGNVNCGAERAANALIKKWGFKKEFKEASRLFGQRKGDPAACHE